MNIQDIAIFKCFIIENTLRDIFISSYRKSLKMTGNPSSIEAFLSNVEPKDAITNAIKHFTPNSTFGYDFWQNANENWRVFFRKMKSNQSYATMEKMHKEAINLPGYFQKLRENWDSAKPWKYESEHATLVRIGLIDPDSQPEPAAEPPAPADSSVDGGSAAVPSTSDIDPLADFDFFDAPSSSTARLKPGEASLNFNNCYKLTFNASDTELIENLGMAFARLAKNKSGDICLILNRESGTKLSVSRHSNVQRHNVTINSKELTTKIRTLININTEYSILSLGKLQSTEDFIIYKLSKKTL